MMPHAVRYAALGWRVLPLFEPLAPGVCSCPKGAACGRDIGKHPRIADWARAASADPATIRRWWSRWPRASIAIATGRGLLVIDIDGVAGQASWLALVGARQVSRTPEASTGRGRHLLFSVEGDARTTKNALGPSIDTRGEGGYVVAAPSTHGSGRCYAWSVAPWDCALAPAPAWLLERLHAPVQRPARSPADPRRGPTGAGHSGPDSSDSGHDAREALRLIRRGATDAQIASLLRDRASYRRRLARSERIAEEYLQRTLGWARSQPVVNPWSGSTRVRIVRAKFERLPTRATGQAAADRVNLWVAGADGEVFARQQVYLHARDTYAAVLGDIPATAWLEAKDYGRALAHTLVGRELEIVIAPGAPRAARMRRVEEHQR